MKLLSLTLVLLTFLTAVINGEIAETSSKIGLQHYAAEDASNRSAKKIKFNEFNKPDTAASGRLFVKKFFSNHMFGQNQKPQIIPIIITGFNTEPPKTDPPIVETPITTTTNTETNIEETPITTPIEPVIDTDIDTGIDTASLPTTDTDEDTAAGSPAAPEETGAVSPAGRLQLFGGASSQEFNQEQNLAGAEEYIVIGQELKGTSFARANRGPANIKLKLRSTKTGQVVIVLIPAKYRGYFPNGQRIILNKKINARPVKRRVVRRRKNRKPSNKKNKNKRRRFLNA